MSDGQIVGSVLDDFVLKYTTTFNFTQYVA